MFQALRNGLFMSRDLGIQLLHVELNIKVVVEFVWGTSINNLNFLSFISDCRRIYRDFWEVRVTCIYCEANGAPNWLAKHARDSIALRMFFILRSFLVIFCLLFQRIVWKSMSHEPSPVRTRMVLSLI